MCTFWIWLSIINFQMIEIHLKHSFLFLLDSRICLNLSFLTIITTPSTALSSLQLSLYMQKTVRIHMMREISEIPFDAARPSEEIMPTCIGDHV